MISNVRSKLPLNMFNTLSRSGMYYILLYVRLIGIESWIRNEKYMWQSHMCMCVFGYGERLYEIDLVIYMLNNMNPKNG